MEGAREGGWLPSRRWREPEAYKLVLLVVVVVVVVDVDVVVDVVIDVVVDVVVVVVVVVVALKSQVQFQELRTIDGSAEDAAHRTS